MKNVSIYVELLLVYLAFLAIAVLFHGSNPAWIDNILSPTTFVFATILAFSTANRKQRMNSIRSLLRKDDALILSIYENSKNLGKDVTVKTQKLIDDWLIVQLDYMLKDFDKNTPELMKLYRYCTSLKASNSQSSSKNKMVDGVEELLKTQKEIIYWVKDKMMVFEWISTITLLSVIIFCLFSISDGSLVYIINLPLICTALILLVLVLRDINSLHWQEAGWIWNRLIDLYTEIDLIPYFPEGIIGGRVSRGSLNLPSKYRLATYAHPYPDMTDKEVRIVDTGV